MSEFSKDLYSAILRQDLSSFVSGAFSCINPGAKYEHNWHIDLICDYLKAVQSGSIKRLIINIPPRTLKSVCISVAFPAWILGHDPAHRIIVASYSQVLSIKHSLDCRFVMGSEIYKELFPTTILSKSHNQKGKFLTTLNGFRFSSSVLGSLTGEGGDLLIIDDPHKPIDINSPKKRLKVIEWFEQTFITRLNNQASGAIIIVMQRLHAEDLSGYLLQNSSIWEHLTLPAIANKQLTFQIGNKGYFMNKEEALHSSRDNIENLINLEKEIGKANFSAQYLQIPLDNEGTFLKEEDICLYEKFEGLYEYYVQSWDTAIKTSLTSDYSVCLSFGVSGGRYYLIHIMRGRLEYPALKKELLSLKTKFAPKYILIEDKASGQQLIQDVKLEGYTEVVPIKPKLDKVTRFAAVIEEFQNGRVLLSNKGILNKLVIKELTTFPNSKNDDVVDAFSQFLNFMKKISTKPLPRIRSLGGTASSTKVFTSEFCEPRPVTRTIDACASSLLNSSCLHLSGFSCS